MYKVRVEGTYVDSLLRYVGPFYRTTAFIILSSLRYTLVLSISSTTATKKLTVWKRKRIISI